MECRGISQISEAKRLVGAFADTDHDDTAQPFVFEFVRLPQARKLAVADQAQSFCFEVKDLQFGAESCVLGTCQVTSAASRCVTSVSKSYLFFKRRIPNTQDADYE
jgi:hypothetical protein